MSKKILNSLSLGFIFSLIISFLIYKQLIYPTIIPMVIKGGASVFSDWTVILNANLCLEKGFDVFTENPCDQWNRKHVYGEILLKIPLIRSFPKFYFLYLPILLGFTFLSCISYLLFNYKNKKYWLTSLIFVFSLPVILVIERANIDLIIFIFLVLITKKNNVILNYFLIIISSIAKIYPIVLTSIFIFQKKVANKLFYISLAFLIFVILSFFQWDSLIKIFSNQKQFSGSGFGLYEFSFLGAIKFLNFLNISSYNNDYNWIKYLYLVLAVFIPIGFLHFVSYSKIKVLFFNFKFNNSSLFEERLYFLSSTIILFCYFSTSNFIYREIFFLGLIPLIMLLIEKNENNFATFYYYLVLIKFFLTTILIYISQNQLIEFLNPFLIIIKHTFDFYLISIVLHIYVHLLVKFFKMTVN